MEPTHIEHPLEPVFDARSRVLVLGTMPSPKSREAGFYYAHPQNRFWKVMGALFGLSLIHISVGSGRVTKIIK